MLRFAIFICTVATIAVVPGIITAQELDSLPIYGSQLEVDVYGNLVTLDRDRNLLLLYSPNGDRVRELGGQGWGNEQFDRPSGIAARNGIDIFVADYGNHRIQRFDRNLSFVSSLFTRDADDERRRFGYPSDVALSRLGELFICDSENTRIVKVNRFSEVERTFGGFDAGEGRLRSPLQLKIGPKDQLYVLDEKRVVVFDTFGNFLHVLAGSLFRKPSAIFADGERVLVLDEQLIYSFDTEDRPDRVIDLETVAEGRLKGKDIRSLAYADSALYFLTRSGLLILTGTDALESKQAVDKDEKSR